MACRGSVVIHGQDMKVGLTGVNLFKQVDQHSPGDGRHPRRDSDRILLEARRVRRRSRPHRIRHRRLRRRPRRGDRRLGGRQERRHRDLGGRLRRHAALVAAAKKEGTLNAIALPRGLGQLRRDHRRLHEEVRDQDQRREPGRRQPGRDQRDHVTQGPGPRPRRGRPRQLLRAERRRSRDCSPRTRSPRGPTSPPARRTPHGPLVRRLRRLHLHRLRRQEGPGVPDDLRRPAQAPVQGPGRAQRRPHQVRFGASAASTRRRWPTAARSTTSSPAWTSSAS